MPMLRASGGRSTPRAAEPTPSQLMRISPAAGRSRPALQRNVVVLPQPDGPSSVTNSPSATARSTELTAASAAKFLLKSSSTTALTAAPPTCGRDRDGDRLY